ncbi:hypothetical protein M1397_02045 [Candidatus Marsarchaeota archaeon]|nr:hypothetical protein [Candidatus Marsarchaeota archaeon]
MVSEESQYDKLLKYIETIEEGGSKPEAGNVDVSETFAGAEVNRKVDYKYALNTINEVEKRVGRFAPRQPRMERQETQPPAQQQMAPTQTLWEAQQEEASTTTPSPTAPIAETTETAAEAPVVETSAAAELAELTKELPLNIPLFSGSELKKVKESDLVLPNLSITDQISELERIMEGIRGGAFGNDDMEIIKEELYGLAVEVDEEKRKTRKAKEIPKGEDYQLLLLRDQRLSNAIDMLSRRLADG